MKIFKTLMFGVAALVAATFATTASAKADSFGFYVGSGGGYGGGYYPGYYAYPAYPVYPAYSYGYRYRPYDRCANRWYRRHHRHCWNYDGGYYGYAPYYRYRSGYAYPYYYSYPSYSIGLRFGHPHHRHWGGHHRW